MNEDGVRVTRIDWVAAIPSLRLLEAIRLGVSLRVFFPALLLILFAWSSTQFSREKSDLLNPAISVHNLLNISEFALPGSVNMINTMLTVVATEGLWHSASAVVMLACWMLGFAFCGVAAMRVAGCRFCTGTGSGLIASVRFALQSWKAILTSALLSWILFGLLWLAFRILCWTGVKTHVCVTVMASLMYIAGCVVLGFGWLLSVAAIAVDGCEGAEALSRGICYVLSRWLRVAVYTIVCCAMIMVCNLCVSWIFDNAHSLITATAGNTNPVQAEKLRTSSRESLLLFKEMICLSIFLCEIAVAYVLLRNVEDGVSLREIDGGRFNNSPSDRSV